ncbi:MAG: GNAT family N-acetyltransferase [Phycisphaerales bacterium]
MTPPAATHNPALPVSIRHPVASDEREFTTLRRESRDHLEQWEPIPSPGHSAFTADDFELFLSSAQSEQRRRFLVVRNSDQRIVGQCSLGGIIRGPLQQAFLGYWIALPFARQGFATQAIQLILSYAFAELLLHRVEANVQPHNVPSIRTVLRVGFRQEGFSPAYLQIAGRWADHNRYAIIADEFWARYPHLAPKP